MEICSFRFLYRKTILLKLKIKTKPIIKVIKKALFLLVFAQLVKFFFLYHFTRVMLNFYVVLHMDHNCENFE